MGEKVTIRKGDRVVFRDRWKKVHVGTVKEWERDYNLKITGMHITNVEDDTCDHLVSVRQVSLYGTPLAAQWLAPVVHLHFGTVVLVTLTGKASDKEYGGVRGGDLGVVLADKGDRVNVARLGSCGADSYGRFPHRCLTVVPLAELTSWPVRSSS